MSAHAIVLTFSLEEEVTPDIFARRVAEACAGSALRAEEGIHLPSDPSLVLRVAEKKVPRRPLPETLDDWFKDV